jgi:glucose-6-phosphate isomerase
LKLDMLGIDLRFNETRFKLYAGGREVKANLRTLADLKPVLADAEFAKKITPAMAKRVQYYMFRGAAKPSEASVFKRAGVSFDVTVLPKLDLGNEFNKTLGHYHERAACGKTYPEVYEVLNGNAIYLLQKKNERGEIVDVVYCSAGKGDQILVPPDYGHVTNNAGNGTLIMANIVALHESDYSEFRRKKGGALYFMKPSRTDAKPKIVSNPAYSSGGRRKAPRAREWKARRIWPNGLYASFIAAPDAFSFLTNPERVLYA